MGDTFSLWDEIKAYAREYAASGRPVPCDGEYEAWLRAHVARNLSGNPERAEAFAFYAQELEAMVRDFREEADDDELAG